MDLFDPGYGRSLSASKTEVLVCNELVFIQVVGRRECSTRGEDVAGLEVDGSLPTPRRTPRAVLLLLFLFFLPVSKCIDRKIIHYSASEKNNSV